MSFVHLSCFLLCCDADFSPDGDLCMDVPEVICRSTCPLGVVQVLDGSHTTITD